MASEKKVASEEAASTESAQLPTQEEKAPGFQKGPKGGTGIFKAIPALMKEVGAVHKSRQSQGYQFRGIDDVYNALHGLMAKHGIFSVPYLLEIKRAQVQQGTKTAQVSLLQVQYTFYHEDGSSFVVKVPGEGSDFSDKSAGKAMSYAHKTALIQVFALETNEQIDPEYNDTPYDGRTEPTYMEQAAAPVEARRSAPPQEQTTRTGFAPSEDAAQPASNISDEVAQELSLVQQQATSLGIKFNQLPASANDARARKEIEGLHVLIQRQQEKDAPRPAAEAPAPRRKTGQRPSVITLGTAIKDSGLPNHDEDKWPRNHAFNRALAKGGFEERIKISDEHPGKFSELGDDAILFLAEGVTSKNIKWQAVNPFPADEEE